MSSDRAAYTVVAVTVPEAVAAAKREASAAGLRVLTLCTVRRAGPGMWRVELAVRPEGGAMTDR